jgi:putative peptidoglycan lipid II flippase
MIACDKLISNKKANYTSKLSMANGKFSLARTQNTILSAAFVLSASSAANALLGFLKNRLLATYFGVDKDLTIFYTADRLPNLIYSVLIVGAVSTVFIPTFTNLRKRNEKSAFETATAIVVATLAVFLLVGTCLYIWAPRIIELLAVGSFSPGEILLGSHIMRLMLIAQVFLVGGSIVTSILQSYKYFLVPALAPVFYNIGMILGIIFLSDKIGVFGPTYGILLGALLHFGIQIPLFLKSDFRFAWANPFKNVNFKKALLLVPPRIIQVTLANIVQTINNSLALLISSPSVIYLKFATQLQYFPVSIFGMSMAAAALPTLASQGDEKSHHKFLNSLYTSIHQMLFLVMPLSAILFVLRVPAVRIVYGARNFPWEGTVHTSIALAFFSISIFAQSANFILTRAFFALKNTKTPVLISLVTAIINVLTATVFTTLFGFGAWGIALTYSITTFIDTFLLVGALKKEVKEMSLKRLLVPFLKISEATLLMMGTLYGGLKLLDVHVLDTTKTINLLILTFVTTLMGGIVYLIFTKLLKVEEIELLYKLLRKLKIAKFLHSTRYTEVDMPQVKQ